MMGTDGPEVRAYELMRAGRLEEALRLAERATLKARICLPAHGLLATILILLGRRRDADLVISEAMACHPGSGDAFDALAHACMLLGDHERSNSLYRKAVNQAPNEGRFWHNLATSERSLGRLLEAEFACNRAIGLDGSLYSAYLVRSELRVQSATDNHVSQLRLELSRQDIDENGRMFLGYALAKELDDLHQFDESFRILSEAAGLRRRRLLYDVAVDERKLLRIEDAFPAPGHHSHGAADDSQRHIFIVGLPRSGTTLLEHILLGLPGVRSNGETDNFARALRAAAAPEGGDVFTRSAAADPAEVARAYARLSDPDGTADRIIEKQPMNYLYLGAILRALPNSKVIFIDRQPLDVCFAMYRTLFAEAYPFSYDFEELARYHAAYDRLMRHWRNAFSGSLLELSYESLVADPSRTCAVVAKHCGLDWDARALEIQTRRSVSLTASAAQIRRPIYGSSSGRWRLYRDELQPLVRALRRLHVALPPDA